VPETPWRNLVKELQDADELAARPARFTALRREALHARHELLIHREAVGMRRNAMLESVYPTPGPLPAPADPRRK
jgi:hypothetical protein